MNGAQLFYSKQFGIGGSDSRSTWLLGLVNSGPYLCCAVLGCWLTIPMNNYFGRRNTIFITCLISALACFWQAFTNSWWHMFIARFALGLGLGPKSATVPMYAAEMSPPGIRGALVMQWQMVRHCPFFLRYPAGCNGATRQENAPHHSNSITQPGRVSGNFDSTSVSIISFEL